MTHIVNDSLGRVFFIVANSFAQPADQRQGVGRDFHVGEADLVASQPRGHTVLHHIAQAQVGVPVARGDQRRGHHVLHHPAAEPVHAVRVHRIGRQRIRARARFAAHRGHHRRNR